MKSVLLGEIRLATTVEMATVEIKSKNAIFQAI
jgi:hypothetical protein